VHKGGAPVEGAGQGVGGALGHGNVGAAGQLQQPQRVGGGQLHGHVAEDGGQGPHVKLGQAQGKLNGHGVVHAGVGVNKEQALVHEQKGKLAGKFGPGR
jgi:hypothetical protein